MLEMCVSCAIKSYVLTVLAYDAFRDLKTGYIDVGIQMAAIVPGLMLVVIYMFLFDGSVEVFAMAGIVIQKIAAALGVLLVGIALSRLSGGAIGEGDAWMAAFLAGILSLKSTLIVFEISIFVQGTAAAVFIMRRFVEFGGLADIRKGALRRGLPFAPSLLAGYVVSLTLKEKMIGIIK